MNDKEPIHLGEWITGVASFKKALTAGVTAAAGFLERDISSWDLSLRFSDEEDVVSFPARVDLGEGAVYVHKESFDDFAADLLDRYEGISYLDLAKLHIAGSVISNAVMQSINPMDKKRINKFLDILTETDTVHEAIGRRFTEIGLDAHDLTQNIIINTDEDTLGEINALRLAFGVLFNSETVTTTEPYLYRESVDFGSRVLAAFLSGVMEMPDKLELYKHASRLMKVEDHFAEQRFFEEVSPLEVAAAFPMSLPEIMVVQKVILQ